MIMFIVGNWRSLAVRGLAAVVFGVLALLWPGLTLQALVLLFGAFVLVDGVAMLVAVLTHAPQTEGRRGLLVFQGILSIAAGVITFFWPGMTALALLYLIAAWALLTGAMEIAAAIRLRREIDNEWILAVSGLLSVVFAVLLVARPGAGALAVTWLIGFYALLYGAFLLALAYRIRQIESGAGSSRRVDGRRHRQAPA
jgi:uncharacterized membrane protein HdeD (DUF308 family)